MIHKRLHDTKQELILHITTNTVNVLGINIGNTKNRYKYSVHILSSFK